MKILEVSRSHKTTEYRISSLGVGGFPISTEKYAYHINILVEESPFPPTRPHNKENDWRIEVLILYRKIE